MRGCRYQSNLLQVQTMIFDIELHCDKWMDCKTKWCNGDGGFWCKEDCKPITQKKKKVEKVEEKEEVKEKVKPAPSAMPIYTQEELDEIEKEEEEEDYYDEDEYSEYDDDEYYEDK